ncbi:YihY/virulence factor BrkB family protein [Salsipaludibacter albus]|uniref:YihY/virulence factor BrkB family protein n=1 Tax=Salsipaludibacter albus TaxID=2849650 RepID=UPI001EE40EE6|nr:YihY/virulence factor BrkB family protein [Salsipaludibacter albus]MBY5163130.1 YihY/virulence factor BrkB family protein [Salsipaludibacter albus]
MGDTRSPEVPVAEPRTRRASDPSDDEVLVPAALDDRGPSPGWTTADLRTFRRTDWTRLANDLRRDLQYRHATLMAAGVAFRAFLAVFSTLVVASSALALAQPAGEIIYQTRRITLGLPASAREVLVTQVETIVLADNTELRITFGVALLLAVWVAASTIQGVMEALTAANGGVERRSWVKRRLIAVALTLGSMVFVAISLAAITGLPVVLGWFDLGEGGSSVLAITGELIGLSLMMFSALLVIYHYGPAEPLPSWRWTWPGAVVATFAWVLGTEGFSQVVEQVGTYNFRYGTVAGIAVLLLWLLLTSWCVLFGAIVNARLARRHTHRRSPSDPILSSAIDEATGRPAEPGEPAGAADPDESVDPVSPGPRRR